MKEEDVVWGKLQLSRDEESLEKGKLMQLQVSCYLQNGCSTVVLWVGRLCRVPWVVPVATSGYPGYRGSGQNLLATVNFSSLLWAQLTPPEFVFTFYEIWLILEILHVFFFNFVCFLKFSPDHFFHPATPHPRDPRDQEARQPEDEDEENKRFGVTHITMCCPAQHINSHFTAASWPSSDHHGHLPPHHHGHDEHQDEHKDDNTSIGENSDIKGENHKFAVFLFILAFPPILDLCLKKEACKSQRCACSKLLLTHPGCFRW